MNFGVIGPGKMGKLFIRDLLNLGAKLSYLKCSNIYKTNKKIKEYKKKNIFFNNKLSLTDFLIISSKTSAHYSYINKFYKQKNLLIEKPFFYFKNKSYQWHLSKAKVFLHSDKVIDVNLSNYLLGEIYKRQKFFNKYKFKNFFFTFYTEGDSTYKFIILDLVPHFFSIIQILTPCKIIKIISKEITQFRCFIVLKIDDYTCYLDLREKQKIKKLSFGFDNFILTRNQIMGKKNTINNFLINKHLNLKIKIPNPLTEFVNKFYNNVKKNSNTLKKKFIYKNFKLTLKTFF